LTLDDALALARQHNRDLRAGRAQLSQAQDYVLQVRAALLPTVTSQGKYTHNYKAVTFNFSAFQAGTVGLAQTIRATTTNAMEAAALDQYIAQTNAMIAATPPIEIQLSEQLDASGSAIVPLIAPSTWYALKAAHASERSSEASYDVNEASVLVGVAQAYFAAAGADELVRARQEAIQVAQQTLQMAKDRFSVRVATRLDVTRAETALVRAQQNLVEAENTQAAAYRGLATQIGTHEALRVEPQPASTRAPEDTAALVQGALATRRELDVQRNTIASARATSFADACRWVPTLSAWGTAHVGNYTGFSGDKYSWAVGLQLDWVIYDGGVRDAQRHIANAQRAEAEARLDLELDTITDEVKNDQGTVETKRKAVIAAERALQLADESLAIVRVQYQAGTATQLDVLQAQDSRVAAQVSLAQAHFDLSIADLQLARATGRFPSPRQ
jgi:outer membrane protein TolC